MVHSEVFTDPVVGKDFFGRDPTLHLLLKRATALRHGYRQNIALLGPELIGKTSLLQHFMLCFNEPETFTVYVDLRRRESFEEFGLRFVALFLHSFLRGLAKGSVEGGEIPLEGFRQWAPQTTLWLKAFLDRKKTSATEGFTGLLELPSRTWKETGKCAVLILDEFDRLLGFDVEEPFALLGKQIMIQKQTLYLLASSRVPLAQTILRQRLSLLFGNFEVVTLNPFDSKTALDYLEKRWHLAALDSEMKQFLIILTGGHPFYLNVIGQHLSPTPASELRQSSKSVLSVLEKLLFNAQGILNQYFTTRLESLMAADPAGKTLAFLECLSKGPQSSQEIGKIFKKTKDFPKKVARLVESGILTKNGDFYRMKDELFAFWLRSCYTRKANLFSGKLFEQSLEFKEEAEATFRHFMIQLRKNRHEKILELFSSFKGEMIEIDQKRHRLPRFSEVQLYNGKKGELTLIGKKDNGIWVSSFFEHEVTEEDVAEFLRQCRCLNRPIYKKIMVPLGGIGENARLYAKKEKLWMWELESVNALLEIFGQGPLLVNGHGGRHG